MCDKYDISFLERLRNLLYSQIFFIDKYLSKYKYKPFHGALFSHFTTLTKLSIPTRKQ